MRVRDLQQFLSSFTAANKDGSRQGNAISNAVIMVQVNGHLEKVVKWKYKKTAHHYRSQRAPVLIVLY